MHIYIYTYIYTHTHTHTYTCTYMNCQNVCTHTQISTHSQFNKRARAHTQVIYWDIKAHAESNGKRTRIRSASSIRDVAWVNEKCRVSWNMSGLLEPSRTESSSSSRDRHDTDVRSTHGGYDAYTRARYTSTGQVYTHSDYRPACDDVTCLRSSDGVPHSDRSPMYVACGDSRGYVYLFAFPCTFAGSYGWRCEGHAGGVCAIMFDPGAAHVV
jgi:hypothetical protein